MAKFCFVSVAAPAHCDFGGMSYVRTAKELMNRGHDVEWVFGLAGPRDKEKAEQLLIKNEIPFTLLPNQTLLFSKSDEDALNSACAFEDHVNSKEFDCLAIDRLCVISAVIANRAQLPWAAIATDGREWRVARPTTLPRGMIPDVPRSEPLGALLRSDFPAPSLESEWVTSPFLSISFFPRDFHKDHLESEFLPNVHFVGSGLASPGPPDAGQILITFGNTFHPALRRQMADLLRQFVSTYDVPTLFLTGNKDQSGMLRTYFNGMPQVTIEDWMPYAEAFQGSAVVIGHGGPAHVWYGIRFGTPLLAVPFFGDQWHGALQVERLNIGRTVSPLARPKDPSRPFQPFVAIDENDFRTALTDLLTDSEPLERMQTMSTALSRGGGVTASASLLERLARDQAPVWGCVEGDCCC